MVEAILQVGRTRPSEKILICAPSNAAADLLLERLAARGISNDMMFRVMASQRNISEVKELVQSYCCYDKNAEEFFIPDFLDEYHYVVCTCGMAPRLRQYVYCGHFKTVFVDECSQATEPEVLGCFTGLVRNDGSSQLVLAGDPKQLGPVINSEVAKTAGLGLSLLERLMEGPLYTKNKTNFPLNLGYNPLCITKLAKCYRCHPDILYVPNKLFYDGELVDCASKNISHAMLSWRKLPNSSSPLVFHGVAGQEIQEASSPSWFNVAEIELVIEYVKQLVGQVKPKDIGIITPYSKQVQKIKIALTRKRIFGVTVGSCEQFQGRERKVMIISTVRSTNSYQGIYGL